MRSVTTTLAVLEAVGVLQPVGVSEVARYTGLAKTTSHRVLQALAEEGWIRATDVERTRWSLTNRVLSLAGQFAKDSDVRALALPAMQELHRRTGETIHLTVPEGTQVVLLDKIDTVKPVRTHSWVGGTAPIHASASGRAMLSHLPDAEVRAVVDASVDAEALLAELAEIRERGYALNVAMWNADVAAAGAAVLDPGGRPVAALSISMPLHRFPEEIREEYGELVRAAAVAATGQPWPS